MCVCGGECVPFFCTFIKNAPVVLCVSQFLSFCFLFGVGALVYIYMQEKHVLERHQLRNMFMNVSSHEPEMKTTPDHHHHHDDDGGWNHQNNDKWKILHDQVVSDSDHGRTLIQFVTQRL